MNQIWYQDGLQFECTGCGACCTGSNSVVRVNSEDIERLYKYLSIPRDLFERRYLRRVNQRWILIDQNGAGDCIFLKENKCEVYEARPRQCRTFPWWPTTLKSSQHWKSLQVHCEGVGHGPVISAQVITDTLMHEALGRSRR